jgi:digeranylgeranylglycerophospholipid reductase
MDFEVLSWGGGWIPMGGPVKQMVDGNVLAVGDAAGLVMPSNGGGISQAMISGKFAADAILAHRNSGTPLDSYEKMVRRSMGRSLRNSLRSKRLGYSFLKGDLMTETILRILGPIGGLKRAMECKRPLWLF